MKNVSFIVLASLVVGGFVGWFLHPAATIVNNLGYTNSSVGVTYNSAKIASKIMVPATAGATTTSLYNGDATDRIIESAFVDCNTLGTSYVANTGTGLAYLRFTAATTSASAPNALGNSNLIIAAAISTSTPDFYVASSTLPADTSYFTRVWAAGSYLTFATNATNTAVCNVGVHYLGF